MPDILPEVDEDLLFDDDAAYRVGAKVIEMAERLKDVAAAIPGARATWNFEIDDVRFHVAVTVAEPAK
jgi:hypothetical protein